MGAREFGLIVVKAASGEPVTTSTAIAEGTGNTHESTIKLVRKYLADLESFGPVGFEIQRGKPQPQGGFAQSSEFAILNEQQASVLITFLRNSDIVRAFKVALIKGFYEMRTALANVTDPLAGLPAEQRALIAVMLDNADIKRVQAEQGASILAIEHRVNEAADAQLLHARPTNAENMGMIRTRINKKHGLSANIIDQVMRQSLYAPKPAGMVKNGHENAQGGSYAVYWTKDITALFARFTAECAPTTATQYTHPLIDGKFKMSGGAA